MRFLGESFPQGRVPIMVLAPRLDALQTCLFHAAATVTHNATARRGQWFQHYLADAGLVFKASYSSDLVIEMEMPRPEGYLPGTVSVGPQALDLFFEVSDAVESAPERVASAIPDRTERAFLLRSLEGLCPSTEDDYQVELENCTGTHPKLTLTGGTRKAIKRLVATATAPDLPECQERTIVGLLTKIHVQIGPPMIAVQVGTGVEISCYYEETIRDQISNLLAGSYVEVSGVASLNNDGSIKQLDNILDVELVSMEPLRLMRFRHGTTRYTLREPVLVRVERFGEGWVYGCPEISLWGFGKRRDDALIDLGENFDFLWHEYAEADSATLDEKAVQLKARLNRLVDSSK